jgi:hypothetical protein
MPNDAVRQRYALATGQKLACGGQVKSGGMARKAAPVEPAKAPMSYQKYGNGYRKVGK